MAGAFSFVLGMLGLGAAGAVSAGQNAKIKKADYQYGEEHGLHRISFCASLKYGRISAAA